MSGILEELEKDTRDASLSLILPIPDSVHVGKSLKAGCANWYLKLQDERGNLAILKTLRNKACPELRKAMRKFLPRNDHVRNKDRPDPAAVIRLAEGEANRVTSDARFRQPYDYPRNGSLHRIQQGGNVSSSHQYRRGSFR